MAGVDAMVEGKTVKVNLRHEQTGLNSNHVDRSRGLHFSQFSQPVIFGMWGWQNMSAFFLTSSMDDVGQRLRKVEADCHVKRAWVSGCRLLGRPGRLVKSKACSRVGTLLDNLSGLVCKRGVYQCSPCDKVLSCNTIPCKDVNQRRLRSTYKPRTLLSKEENENEAPQASRSTDQNNPRFWHLFRHDF